MLLGVRWRKVRSDTMELPEPNPADHMLMFKKKLWITEYSTRVQRMLRGEKLPPLMIDAEPHRRCSFKCLHCSRNTLDFDINEYSKRVEIPEERWYEIARESGEMGVKSWNIAGLGEPMLKPEMMMRLMTTIKEQGMFGELTTNGWYWTRDNIRKAVEIRWDCISVSIDGPDAASHEAIRRVPGSFKRACRTVKLLAELRRKRKTHLPNLTVNVVLSGYNYNRLPEMVELTRKLGADVLFVEPMVMYSEDQRKNVMVTQAQRNTLRKVVENAVRLAEKRNIYAFITCLDGDDEVKEFNPELVESGGALRDVILRGTEEQAEKYINDGGLSERDEMVRHVMNIPCYYPWLHLMITAEGNAVHCGECTVLKDNIKDKSLNEIWWGSHLKKYRARHSKGNLSQFCEKCRPNVIGDMKLVRKSINEYGDVRRVQEKLALMMEHALNLKRDLYYANYSGFFRPVKNRLFPPEKSVAAAVRLMNI